MTGLHFLDGLLVGYDRQAPDAVRSGMQAQMAASNEQAMRASMQAQALPRDDTEYLRGLMNAYVPPERPGLIETARIYRAEMTLIALRQELARPDWVFIWWLGFLGLGALLRWRFW